MDLKLFAGYVAVDFQQDHVMVFKGDSSISAYSTVTNLNPCDRKIVMILPGLDIAGVETNTNMKKYLVLLVKLAAAFPDKLFVVFDYKLVDSHSDVSPYLAIEKSFKKGFFEFKFNFKMDQTMRLLVDVIVHSFGFEALRVIMKCVDIRRVLAVERFCIGDYLADGTQEVSPGEASAFRYEAFDKQMTAHIVDVEMKKFVKEIRFLVFDQEGKNMVAYDNVLDANTAIDLFHPGHGLGLSYISNEWSETQLPDWMKKQIAVFYVALDALIRELVDGQNE